MPEPLIDKHALTSLRASDLSSGDSAWHTLLDDLDCGVAIFDASTRLVTCNSGFRQQYPAIAEHLVPGARFEDLLRLAYDAGLIPQAVDQGANWVADRLRAFGQPGPPLVRQMANGRWRRITETRLADGGVLSFSVDITAMVTQGQALEQALADSRRASEQLHDAIEALPAGFELWDENDRLVTWNSETLRLYPRIASLFQQGVSFEDLVRANHAAGGLTVPAEDLDDYIAARTQQRRTLRSPIDRMDQGAWIRNYYEPASHGSLVGVRIDVTELHTQRAAAEQAHADAESARRQLYDAIEALPDGFALYDADDRLVICNSRYRDLYRESAPAMRIGAHFEEILRYGLAQGQYPQAAGQEEEWLASRLLRHRNPGAPEIQQLPGNRWMRIDERVTGDGGVAGVRADVTELVRREQQLIELNTQLAAARAQLEALSETDSLTGIANRRQFDRRLIEDWARLSRYDAPLALLMIDIDHFKRYNDLYGHQEGDACLRSVAQALAGCAARATDLVARYGGEEFALLLPHVDRDAAGIMAQNCLSSVAALGISHGDSPTADFLTVSIGVAWVDKALPQQHSGSLLRAADLSLYRAKMSGRHRASLSWEDPSAAAPVR